MNIHADSELTWKAILSSVLSAKPLWNHIRVFIGDVISPAVNVVKRRDYTEVEVLPNCIYR